MMISPPPPPPVPLTQVVSLPIAPASAISPYSPMWIGTEDAPKKTTVDFSMDNRGSFHITTTLEQTPASYFEQAKTIEIFDTKKQIWVRIDQKTLHTLQKWRLTDEHLNQLLEHDISLVQAAHQLTVFAKEGSINQDMEPQELTEYLITIPPSNYLSLKDRILSPIKSFFATKSDTGISMLKALKDLEGDFNFDMKLLPDIIEAVNNRNKNTIQKLPNDIEFEYIFSGSKIVFKLSNYPDLIFKIIPLGRDPDINSYRKEFIKNSFQKRLDAQRLIYNNGFHLLRLPQFQTIDIGEYLPDGGTLIIEEKLPFISTQCGFQEELFKKYGEKLDLALRQYVSFMFKGDGMGDLHCSNLLIMDETDEQGNYKFGLIDVDHLGEGLTDGLIGNNDSPLDMYSKTGLLQFLTEAQIETLADQIKTELGNLPAQAYFWFTGFNNKVAKRKKLIELDNALAEYHQKRNITGSEPLELTLEDLGLVATKPKQLEELLMMLPNPAMIKEKNWGGAQEDARKDAELIEQKLQEISQLYDSFYENYNSDLENLIYHFNDINEKINSKLEDQSNQISLKAKRNVKISIGSAYPIDLILSKLKEKGYIFDYQNIGWCYIQL